MVVWCTPLSGSSFGKMVLFVASLMGWFGDSLSNLKAYLRKIRVESDFGWWESAFYFHWEDGCCLEHAKDFPYW